MTSLILNVVLAILFISLVWYHTERKKFWIKHVNGAYRMHDTLAYQVNALDVLLMNSKFWNPNHTRYQMVSHLLRLAMRVDPTPIEELWQHTVDTVSEPHATGVKMHLKPMPTDSTLEGIYEKVHLTTWIWSWHMDWEDIQPPSFANAIRASLAIHKERQYAEEHRTDCS